MKLAKEIATLSVLRQNVRGKKKTGRKKHRKDDVDIEPQSDCEVKAKNANMGKPAPDDEGDNLPDVFTPDNDLSGDSSLPTNSVSDITVSYTT